MEGYAILGLNNQRPREDLSRVLFELANPDRLVLLSNVVAKKQRLSNLSKTINCSVPECLRHLSRLTDSGLLRKDPSGSYEATPVGSAILRLLPGLETISRYRNYFMTHELSVLPEDFIQRISVLSEVDHATHLSDVVDEIKACMRAERSSLLLVDKPIFFGKENELGGDRRNIPARFIFAESIGQRTLATIKASFPRSSIALTKEVRIAVGVNEKRAGVIFPSGGKLDFGNGFFGQSPRFRAWCTELFEYYWANAEKILSPPP